MDIAHLDFSGATLDSRAVRPGMLFVALKGAHTDGRAFIPAAQAAGAAGIITGREALTEAAFAYRKTLRATVIGVTGSAGKTTTKELLAAFLRAGGHKVHATAGNFNNDLGLPLTILNCPRDADFLVLEMGTNHPGEIAHLARVAAPHAGIVSSVGTAHIEFFRTRAAIADEKGALLAALPADGFAVLPRTDDFCEALRAKCASPAETVSHEDALGERLARALAGRLPGVHNVTNARLAFACARRFGVSEEACFSALEGFSLPGGRWRTHTCEGVLYIDDAYNANPSSMQAALDAFAALPVAGRRIAVLGDMFELGDDAPGLHGQLGRYVRTLPIDRLVTVGGMSARCMGGDVACQDAAEAGRTLRGFVRPGDAVLLKASRGMHLEEALDFLKELPAGR